MSVYESFSPHDPYTPERASGYRRHHKSTPRRRLTSWRERRCLAAALELAGAPERILDMPCGAGRFWQTFSDAGARELIAMDLSPGMLAEAAAAGLPEGLNGLLIQSDAFRIPLARNTVDFVACMRFAHHLSMPEYRSRLLAELARVSRRYLAVSVWVDGNYGARRRRAKSLREPIPGYGGRHCLPRAELESEFQQAGFSLVDWFDVWPKVSMWRLYLLELRPEEA